ncbi:hypothetical protein AB1Y20_014467 [Prymnesium parvum]|uniref:Cyclic nucleotide-binding domain-containing protein n=1 Tax=Prymnesium parvum TaxID=97485 RepID=A0AB34IGP1_PRYPA
MSHGSWVQEEEDVVWTRVRRKLRGVLSSIDKLIDSSPSADAPPSRLPADSPHARHRPSHASLHLSAEERRVLCDAAQLPPSHRSHEQICAMIHALRGSEVLLRLDEPVTAAFVGAMRWEEHVEGAAVVPETCHADAYVLLVEGLLAVRVREREAKQSRRVGYVHPGDSVCEASFGDCAAGRVESVSGRVAELRAAAHSSVMRVTRQDFNAAMKNWHGILLERKMQQLMAVPLFSCEETRLLRSIAERCAHEKTERGSVIIKQGQEARRVHIVLSGECHVIIRVPADSAAPPKGEGEPHDTLHLQVATLGPRDVFGEVGVMLDTPHTASVVAASEVRFLAIHKADLLTLADSSLIGRLTEAANGYPSEAQLKQQLVLGNHWRAYKEALVTGVLDDKVWRKFKRGAPSREAVIARPRGYAIVPAVEKDYFIASDGHSTPVLRLDLRDLQVRADRKVGMGHIDADLANYLSRRPGGTAWKGNANFREYLKKEEARERAEMARAARRRAASAEAGGGVCSSTFARASVSSKGSAGFVAESERLHPARGGKEAAGELFINPMRWAMAERKASQPRPSESKAWGSSSLGHATALPVLGMRRSASTPQHHRKNSNVRGLRSAGVLRAV